MLVEQLDSKVLRAAFLTLVVIAAVEQFVGWKYLGVFSKEAVFALESRLTPWPDMPPVTNGEAHEEKHVATLLIGNEYFADPAGFNHTVPLPADKLLPLLETIAKAAPESRIAIDFDLSPRSEAPGPEAGAAEPQPRRGLDQWLLKNTRRLVLVEPSWALRPGIVQAQRDWMKALCRPASGAVPAVFVQSALVSTFGVVNDQQAVWDERKPAWDFGRGIADQIGETPLLRDPLCDALLKPAGDDADDLESELALHHHLPIPAQPMAPKPTREERLLRQEFLATKPCPLASASAVESRCDSLGRASVVMLGGGWRFGYGDQHPTFVGELDGARVHAAWIRSWLQPVEHLPLILHVLLDLIVIEYFLNPVLEYALHELRRLSRWQAAAAQRSTEGRGLAALRQLALLAAIAAAAFVSLLTLCLIDLSLRAVTGFTIAVDVSLMALISWLLVRSYTTAAERPLTSHERDEERQEAIRAAAWLVGGACFAWLLLRLMGLDWGHAVQTRRALLITALGLLALTYLAWALRLRMRHFDLQKDDAARDERETRMAHTWASITASLTRLRGVPRLLVQPGQGREAMRRLLDCTGLGLWLAVWLFSFWTVLRPQLYGLWATTFGG